jgi:hypothetical protein
VSALYRSWPTPMKPVMSLSNTWKPRQYSSGSPGSRNPPGRLSTFWKDSKSTVHKRFVSDIQYAISSHLCPSPNQSAPCTASPSLPIQLPQETGLTHSRRQRPSPAPGSPPASGSARRRAAGHQATPALRGRFRACQRGRTPPCSLSKPVSHQNVSHSAQRRRAGCTWRQQRVRFGFVYARKGAAGHGDAKNRSRRGEAIRTIV